MTNLAVSGQFIFWEILGSLEFKSKVPIQRAHTPVWRFRGHYDHSHPILCMSRSINADIFHKNIYQHFRSLYTGPEPSSLFCDSLRVSWLRIKAFLLQGVVLYTSLCSRDCRQCSDYRGILISVCPVLGVPILGLLTWLVQHVAAIVPERINQFLTTFNLYDSSCLPQTCLPQTLQKYNCTYVH